MTEQKYRKRVIGRYRFNQEPTLIVDATCLCNEESCGEGYVVGAEHYVDGSFSKIWYPFNDENKWTKIEDAEEEEQVKNTSKAQRQIKVGDVVRIREDAEKICDDGYGPGWNDSMNAFIGKSAVVVEARHADQDWLVLDADDCRWTWDARCLDLVEKKEEKRAVRSPATQCPVIQYRHYRDYTHPSNKGGITVAFIREKSEDGDENNDTIRYAVAWCSPKDNFCRKTGRELAEQRLNDSGLCERISIRTLKRLTRGGGVFLNDTDYFDFMFA